jgi:AAA ATPase domain
MQKRRRRRRPESSRCCNPLAERQCHQRGRARYRRSSGGEAARLAVRAACECANPTYRAAGCTGQPGGRDLRGDQGEKPASRCDRRAQTLSGIFREPARPRVWDGRCVKSPNCATVLLAWGLFMESRAPAPVRPTRLRGRESECAQLDALIVDVSRGESRSLVLKGEAGIGKTALLEYLVGSVSDFSILRAIGVESVTVQWLGPAQASWGNGSPRLCAGIRSLR